MRHLSRLLTVLGLLLALPLHAEPPRFELVYTQPAETTLQQPLRMPAPAWVGLFDGALKTIDIEQFYLAEKTGEALDPVLAALEKAARRGVHVRVLVDKQMVKQSQPTLDRIAGWPNAEVRVIPWSKLDPGNGRHPGGIIHAKFMCIDGKWAYEGSQNFDWRSLSNIHELGVLIRDARIAGQLQAIFDMDWRAQQLLAEGKPVPVTHPSDRPAAERNETAYLVASPHEFLPPGVGDSELELPRLIGTAQKRLQIQVLKYEPLDHAHHFYPVIDDALRAAAARGVEIELMVSDWNADMPGLRWLQSLAVLPHVQVRMVTIPLPKAGFVPFSRVVHSKYMIVDGQALWVGTSNWQGGYLNESRNVEMVLLVPEVVAQAVALHAQLWSSAYAQPVVAGKDYPKPRRE
jgi:phosphatidylserine/phosphatidylglycerophosphate/cardiolipin synthase-like enzyme